MRFRNFFVALVALFAIGSLSVSTAAAETVSSKTEITPRGKLSKTEKRPVDVYLEAKVMPDPGATSLRELVNTKLNLPKDLTFSTKGSEVCRKDIGQDNPENANRSTEAVIAECPNSVVGGGTAVINVAGQVAAAVTDPVLTVFNGGDDADGNPILLIHGYSASVLPGGHGVPMKGVLKGGVLDVSVPTLAANSAVSEFTFNLPGKVGKDPKYAQASCSTGEWVSNAVLSLGVQDPNTGQYVKEDFTTPKQTQKCTGEGPSGGGGKAGLAAPKVKGPGSVKAGKSGTYTVTLKNTGKKALKGVKVAASGKGAKGAKKVGTIKPGKSAKAKVKVKFTSKGTVKVKFKATAKGVKAKTKTFKVKVK